VALAPHAKCSEFHEQAFGTRFAMSGRDAALPRPLRKGLRNMEELAHAKEGYSDILARLNRASVSKRFEAYVDVPWDDAAARVDPSDPRWQENVSDILGGNAWYQSQPEAVRARIALGFVAYQMKRGVEFENILSRGLLGFALKQPNGSAAYRYAYHEVIEEGQHSLMFQEFVNRSGCDVHALAGLYKVLSETVPRLGRVFPALFFVYVLAGEVPIDQTQRALLRRGDRLHPLLRRIVQIHVTEEARHVCFAHKYLASHVAGLSWFQRLQIQHFAPFVVSQTARLMLRPPRAFTRQLGIPDRVMREVYASASYLQYMRNAVQPLYETLSELGLTPAFTAHLWRWVGIRSAQTGRSALPSGRTPLLMK
jgi:hypothetical protein